MTFNMAPIRFRKTIGFAFLMMAFCCLPASGEALWVFFSHEPGWECGAPVPVEHVEAVVRAGGSIRTVSRYFDGVSVEWDGDTAALEALSCVECVQKVRSRGRRVPDSGNSGTGILVSAGKTAAYSLDYGVSLLQLETLNIPALHDMGFTGEGIRIGVIDTGFNPAATTCLENLRIENTRNFLTGNEYVGGDSHGTEVLACLAGAREGEYYGPAFGATFFLAVTDDVPTETRADEDRWVAAVEWCDSLGVDIISSSLVYNTFDNPGESYTLSDMDGATSLAARAAEAAVSRGILVVNSAGNEGNTIWGGITTPADAEHVIAVGATAYRFGSPVISSMSSRGPTADGRIKPDVVAPGEDVYVPRLGFPGRYFNQSGTSFSAPLVSGLCALLLEAHPDWDPATVMDSLTQSCLDMGDPGADNLYGWGIPDALKAYGYSPVYVERDDAPESQPRMFTLLVPYPNPFNDSITIPFSMLTEGRVSLHIYDITGRHIAVLGNSFLPRGRHEMIWNAREKASGVYVVKALENDRTTCRKITLLR